MTIKEQLKEAIHNSEVESIPNSAMYNYDITLASELCEQVVENISIKFVEWLNKNAYIGSSEYREDNVKSIRSFEQLFELFKKENNL